MLYKKRFLLLILISILILLAVGLDYYHYRLPQQSLFSQFSHISSTNSIDYQDLSKKGLHLKFNSHADPFLIVPLVAESNFPLYLEISLENIVGFEQLHIFYKEKDKSGFILENMKQRDVGERHSRYGMILPPGNYDAIRIDFEGTLQDSSVTITDLTLSHYSLIFYNLHYPFGLLLFLLFVSPGILMYFNLVRERHYSRFGLLNYGFMLSIVYYLVAFVVYFITSRSGYNGDLFLAGYIIFSMAILGLLIKKKKTSGSAKIILFECKWDYCTALFLLFVSLFIITSNENKPFENLIYRDISKDKIFSRFKGHDNAFQYFNGMAIAKQESFYKYYGDGRLTYQVQDREMLPGVLYATIRVFIKNFNPATAASFLTYAIIGTIMNIMIILQILLLFDRYLPNLGRLKYLLILFLSLNAFVLANYYFTWFKFAGGALFLSGLLCLLTNKTRFSSWLVAGMLFGLGANMHTSNALSIPLLFLWLVYLLFREDKKKRFSYHLLFYPVCLCLTFALTLLPWSIVKALYYPDNYTLIKQSFLAGGMKTGSLFDSVRYFMETHPIKEQLAVRTQRLFDTFRLVRLQYFGEAYQEFTLTRFLYYWNNYEFFFFIFSIYSLTIVSMVSWFQRSVALVATRLARKKIVFSSHTIQHLKESLSLAALSLLTVFSLIFLTYGYPFPDTNHSLPAGTILLIHAGLIGLIAQFGIFGYITLSIYSTFTAYRLFTMCL